MPDGSDLLTPIVPVTIGEDWQAVRFWKALYDEGVYANVALYPAVPRGGALLRTSVMATHERSHLDARWPPSSGPASASRRRRLLARAGGAGASRAAARSAGPRRGGRPRPPSSARSCLHQGAALDLQQVQQVRGVAERVGHRAAAVERPGRRQLAVHEGQERVAARGRPVVQGRERSTAAVSSMVAGRMVISCSCRMVSSLLVTGMSFRLVTDYHRLT